MTMLAISKKATFELGGLTGVVDEVKPQYVILDFDDRGPKMYKPHELQDAYTEGQFKILQAKTVHVAQNITDPTTSVRFNFIQSVVHYLHDSGFPQSKRVAEEAIKHTVKKCGLLDGVAPSAATAKRWYKTWERNENSVSYVLKKSKERRRSQFTRECEALADKIIDENYLQLHGCSRAHTFRLFREAFELCKHKWERANRQDNQNTGESVALIKPMCRSTFYSYIDKLDAYEVDKARLGVKAARNKHRCVKGNIVTNRPLERVEVDAVHLNICLKIRHDDETVSYVRPIVYVALDVHTRLVVGYVIDYSEGKPGETSDAVVRLIKQICQPFKSGKFTKHNFPLGGKPEMIVSDSGSAFNAVPVRMMMQSNAITHAVTQKASPWKKPFVERFFGTFKMQCMQTLPGYVGPRVRGVELDNTLEEMAQLTVEEFETKLEEYILGHYHNTPHRGIDNWTPLDKWEAIKDSCAPQMACDFSKVAQFHGIPAERVISLATGFRLNGVTYNSPELQKLAHILARANKNRPDARKVNLMYSVSDITEVTVINPFNSEELISVPAINADVQDGMSLEEYKAIQLARQGGNKDAPSMASEKTKKKTGKSKRGAAGDAVPITDGQDPTRQATDNAIGKIADVHDHKTVTRGSKFSTPPSPSNNNLQASARR